MAKTKTPVATGPGRLAGKIAVVTGAAGNLDGQRFQPAQAARRLGERILAGAGPVFGGAVDGRDGWEGERHI